MKRSAGAAKRRVKRVVKEGGVHVHDVRAARKSGEEVVSSDATPESLAMKWHGSIVASSSHPLTCFLEDDLERLPFALAFFDCCLLMLVFGESAEREHEWRPAFEGAAFSSEGLVCEGAAAAEGAAADVLLLLLLLIGYGMFVQA